MKKIFSVLSGGYLCRLSAMVLVVSSLVLFGCGGSGSNKHEDEHEHAEAAGHDHEGEEGHDHEGEEGHDHEAEKEGAESHGDEIEMTPEAMMSAKIKLMKVVAGSFREVVKTSGMVETPKGGERLISAPVSGIVSFRSDLTPGQAVSAGQSLFTISAKGTEKADVNAAAKITLSLAKKELERADALMKDKLISKQEYDKVKADYAAASAAASGVGARSVSGMSMSAPMSGWLVALNVSPGSFVETGATLAIVAQNRQLVLKADVSERDRDMLGGITGANIRIGQRVLKLNDYGFRLMSRGQGSATAHYIPVYMEFNNPGGITSGTTAEVWLLGTEKRGVISLPKSALVEDNGLFFVYVEEHAGAFKRVEVQTGAFDGANVEILDGLKVGEKVVVNGALRVKMAGMGSAIQGHSHNH